MTDAEEDRLSRVVSQLALQLAEDGEEEDQRTFRAVIREGYRALDARLHRLEERQDQMMLLLVGVVIAQVVVPLVGG